MSLNLPIVKITEYLLITGTVIRLIGSSEGNHLKPFLKVGNTWVCVLLPLIDHFLGRPTPGMIFPDVYFSLTLRSNCKGWHCFNLSEISTSFWRGLEFKTIFIFIFSQTLRNPARCGYPMVTMQLYFCNAQLFAKLGISLLKYPTSE